MLFSEASHHALKTLWLYELLSPPKRLVQRLERKQILRTGHNDSVSAPAICTRQVRAWSGQESGISGLWHDSDTSQRQPDGAPWPGQSTARQSGSYRRLSVGRFILTHCHTCFLSSAQILGSSLFQVGRQEVALGIVIGIQVFIQRLQAVGAEAAGCLLQAQVIQNIVVAGVVIVAHRCIQLALSIQHVNNGAGAYFIADLCRLYGALAGDDALFTRLYLLNIGIYGTMQVAGVLHCLATQAFFAVFGIM